MEEEEGYLTGDTGPFIMDSSEEAIVVCPVEEREEREDLPPRDDNVESTEVFIEEMLEMFLTGGMVGAPVSVVDPRADLKGRLYMLKDVFGDTGVELGAVGRSGTPLGSE